MDALPDHDRCADVRFVLRCACQSLAARQSESHVQPTLLHCEVCQQRSLIFCRCSNLGCYMVDQPRLHFICVDDSADFIILSHPIRRAFAAHVSIVARDGIGYNRLTLR